MPTYEPFMSRRASRPSGAMLGGKYYRSGSSVGTALTSAALNPQSTLTDLLAEMQQARDDANAANEARYAEILSGLETAGTQEEADIRTDYGKLEAEGMSDLVGRGIRGSTLAQNVRSGAQRGMTADVGRLRERLRAQRYGFVERREDVGPSLSEIAGLASQIGQASGGYGLYMPTGGSRTRGVNVRDQQGNVSFRAPGGVGMFQQAANTGVPRRTGRTPYGVYNFMG